jgi:hypothetical protein
MIIKNIYTGMIFKKKSRYLALSLAVFSINVFAQQANLDWKMHDVGNIKQLVTNMGTLWRSQTNYPGLIYSEYPVESGEEHVGEGGIWIGSIAGNDTLVSVTTSWNSSNEFFPSGNSWDSVWVVNRDDTVDIPYWRQYIGRSDQDLVCRYSDYNITNISNHRPLYVDVIQKSYAWASKPVNEQLVFTYYIIPARTDLKQAYISFWLDGNVGYRGQGWEFALDDYSVFYEDRKMGASIDYPGGADGSAIGPIGVKIFPPAGIPEASLRWTFNWYPGQGLGSPPASDGERYRQMASGIIMENQFEPMGSQFMISFGPFDVAVGDTLEFSAGLIFGQGEKGLLENEEMLEWLFNQDYRVPAPPPVPPLKVETRNGEITLNWLPREGEVNPETYKDPYRADSIDQPFEGYRVYKSTRSQGGPWTLLAEYDVINDQGNNYGLQHEYVDRGLLNNIEYYYAVTSFSKEDTVIGFPSQESSLMRSSVIAVPGTEPPATVGEVAVVPNPYRGDIAYHTYNPPWEKSPSGRKWLEQDRRIQFINLPQECEIKVYSLSGDFIISIYHSHLARGYEDWNLTSSVGQAIASGIYLFTVEDKLTGNVQVGKFVVIK